MVIIGCRLLCDVCCSCVSVRCLSIVVNCRVLRGACKFLFLICCVAIGICRLVFELFVGFC